MAQAVYWHPRDPRQGLIAAGFAEACRYCPPNKQGALSRAAQDWHTEVGALPPDQRTPDAIETVAEDTAAKHGVLQVFQIGMQRTIMILSPTGGPGKPPELTTIVPMGAPAGTLPGLGAPPPSRRDVRREQRDERQEVNQSRRGFRKSERPTTTAIAGLEDGIGELPPTTDPARDEWLVERLYRSYVESQSKYQDTQLERDRIALEQSRLKYETGLKAWEAGVSVPKAISHDVTSVPKSLGHDAADAAKRAAQEAADAARDIGSSGAGAVVVGVLVGGAVVFGLGYYALTTGTATEAVKAGVAHGKETGKTVRSLGKTAGKVAAGR